VQRLHLASGLITVTDCTMRAEEGQFVGRKTMLLKTLLASPHCKHGDDMTHLCYIQQTELFFKDKYSILTLNSYPANVDNL
jgi:hypothetical protein